MSSLHWGYIWKCVHGITLVISEVLTQHSSPYHHTPPVFLWSYKAIRKLVSHLVVGWPWLDTWYSLICSIIPLLSRTKDGKYHGKDLMGQDKSSLIKQRSHREAKDNKKLTPYFPLAGMSSHLTGSRASVRRVVAPEHKCHSKWRKAV